MEAAFSTNLEFTFITPQTIPERTIAIVLELVDYENGQWCVCMCECMYVCVCLFATQLSCCQLSKLTIAIIQPRFAQKSPPAKSSLSLWSKPDKWTPEMYNALMQNLKFYLLIEYIHGTNSF